MPSEFPDGSGFRTKQGQSTSSSGHNTISNESSANFQPAFNNSSSKRTGKQRANSLSVKRSFETRLPKKRRNCTPRKLGCPVHKHHLMHEQSSQCGGINASYLSEIRQHLQPRRSARHDSYPAFLALCRTCNEHIIDERVWYDVHFCGNCEPSPQARGDAASRWILLYRTLYPEDTRIPSPCKSYDSMVQISY